MEKTCSYLLLSLAVIAVLVFGPQAVQLPESFARRGALPTLAEWRATRDPNTASLSRNSQLSY